MLWGNDIYVPETDYEQAMSVNVTKPFTNKQMDAHMLREATSRV